MQHIKNKPYPGKQDENGEKVEWSWELFDDDVMVNMAWPRNTRRSQPDWSCR